MKVWKLNIVSNEEDYFIRPLYVEAETGEEAELIALDNYYQPLGHAVGVPDGEIPANVLRSVS